MNQNSTSDILIKYIYGEAAPLEYVSMLESLHSSEAARQELALLKRIKNKLPAISLSPSICIINNILDYNKASTGEFAS